VIEIDERVHFPKLGMKFFTCDHFAGVVNQYRQDLELAALKVAAAYRFLRSSFDRRLISNESKRSRAEG